MPFGKYKGNKQIQVALYHPRYFLTLTRKNKYFNPEDRAISLARAQTRRYLDYENDWGLGQDMF